MVKVKADGSKTLIYDEINRHLDARYVSQFEADWHLRNMQFKEEVIINDATEEQMANLLDKSTKLTAFFEWCKNNPNEKVLYKDLPKTMTWDRKAWKKRKAYFNTLGRMYTVSPADGELFYLRMLLSNVESPHSYEWLYTYDGKKYDSLPSLLSQRAYQK
uniref:Uncharacterized protein n=1 Tax=Ditylenchus dipsaci TaxID=166011 RepID=A0A915E8I4_9BILA